MTEPAARELPYVTRHILHQWRVGVLATYSSNGIDGVPVVFHYDGQVIWVPQDGKPKGEGRLQRFVNVAANPACTFLLQHYSSNWDDLWWLRLRGQGVESSLGQQVRYRLASKYPQYATTALGSRALRFEITTARLWSARPLTLQAVDAAVQQQASS